ncbi:hypothetical protein Q7P36_006593 [Cladosporium allicinum]
MAPNGTSRKTPAPSQRRDSKPLGDLFESLEDVTSPKLKPDVKSSLPVVKKPGSWDSENGNGMSFTCEKKANRPSLVKRPPSDITKAFQTGRPLMDTPKMLKCNHCKRTVTEHAMPKHIEGCLNKKQEKQRKKKEAKDARDAAARKEKGQDSDEEEEGERSAVKGGAASKKRKAADETEEGAPTKKKKKKDEAKAKASKPKAPVDVERQCGVELPQGGQCARSLTCKSHSMGAKRAVPGRSAPYDKLLMEYQRKNQAKLQKAQFEANAPDPDDDALPSGPIDEEEEKEQFMAGIAQGWGGAPLVGSIMVPMRKKYERTRIKSMIHSAFPSRNGSNIFTVQGGGGGYEGLFGQAKDAAEDTGVVHARKPSVAPGARSMVPPARKASVASG